VVFSSPPRGECEVARFMRAHIMNANEINLELKKFDPFTRGYAFDRNQAIAFVFRCDIKTIRNIISRVGRKLGIDNDPVLILKTADALTISQCALDELRHIDREANGHHEFPKLNPLAHHP
jgi:hypothetical protein